MCEGEYNEWLTEYNRTLEDCRDLEKYGGCINEEPRFFIPKGDGFCSIEGSSDGIYKISTKLGYRR